MRTILIMLNLLKCKRYLHLKKLQQYFISILMIYYVDLRHTKPGEYDIYRYFWYRPVDISYIKFIQICATCFEY